MAMNFNKPSRDDKTRKALIEAQESVLRLKSPPLDRVIDYLKLQGENEMFRCSALDDPTQLRRAQGRAAAIAALVELLEYEPIAHQTSVVSKQV